MPRDCTARPYLEFSSYGGDTMYSPVLCGGIQYSHTMAKSKQSKGTAHNHVYKGLRDTLLVPAPGQTVTNAFTATTDANGNGNFAQVLTPLGVTSATLGASSYTDGTPGNVTGPAMRGFFYKASQFQMYRVTRAKLVFVSALGNNAYGSITMAAYTDPADVASNTYDITLATANTRKFDVANASAKEISIPVPVDTSWKKVSTYLTRPGNIYPMTAATAGSLAVYATIADISFGALSVVWQQVGTAGTTTAGSVVGQFQLDYDVEFKNPIDQSLNR